MLKNNKKLILPISILAISLMAVYGLQKNKQSPIILVLWLSCLAFNFIASVEDVKNKVIPNQLLIVMLTAWIAIFVPQLFLNTENTLSLLVNSLLGLAAGGIIFLTVYMISRKGLGGGDVKLMSVNGMYIGLDLVLSTMLFGSVLAGIGGLMLILIKKIDKKDTIPLVPFLYAGMLLAMLIR